MTNETHDPALRSWVASANNAACDFPLQNLPFAVYRRSGSDDAWRVGVGIGDSILPVSGLIAGNNLPGAAASAAAACQQPALNNLMQCGQAAWSALRLALSRALREGSAEQAGLAPALVPMTAAEFSIPAKIGDFTDMYTSLDHALNVGRLFRPDNPLMPNFKWLPCGYHARVSSIGISGQTFHRPRGQLMPLAPRPPWSVRRADSITSSS